MQLRRLGNQVGSVGELGGGVDLQTQGEGGEVCGDGNQSGDGEWVGGNVR
jgi:hypothetical protein